MPEINTSYLWLATLVMFLVCFGLRSGVFMLFGNGQKPPKLVLYIGSVISPAIIAALIVYCLRNTRFNGPFYGLPELAAVSTCVLLHLWKRNALISIIVSTVVYMLLVQHL